MGDDAGGALGQRAPRRRRVPPQAEGEQPDHRGAALPPPRGELGVHMVSDGGTRPYRVHYRDPSFTNLQAVAAMCEGGMLADVIASVASIDPVMGGVDR